MKSAGLNDILKKDFQETNLFLNTSTIFKRDIFFEKRVLKQKIKESCNFLHLYS